MNRRTKTKIIILIIIGFIFTTGIIGLLLSEKTKEHSYINNGTNGTQIHSEKMINNINIER